MIFIQDSLLTIHDNHSVLKLFTGFAIAAFIAWKLTVSKAINKAPIPATPKTHQLMVIRYAKLCNHLFITHQATGNAMHDAMNTSFKNSFESICVTCVTLAPSTLRIPISFVRCSAV